MVGGRYRIEGLIGCGGMGAVYEAVQLGLGRRVALKTMLARSLRDPESLLRFRREATAIASIRHPGIVQVQDLGNLGFELAGFCCSGHWQGPSVISELPCWLGLSRQNSSGGR